MPVRGDAAHRARELMTFCDGLQAGGLHDYASRARMVARDVIDLVHDLAAAQSLADTQRQRLDDYIAYHRAHCFNPDGTAKQERRA